MLKNKQLLMIIVLTVIFIVLLLSWNLFRDKPISIHAKPLDLTATVSLVGQEFTSDNLLTLSYKWQTGPQWKTPQGSPVIFVHLQDEDGERLCQDDHIPPVSITSWKPNETYEYSRTMYIPITLLKKKILLLTGMYDSKAPDTFYAINGLQKFNKYHRYLAQEFVLAPSDLEYSEALIKYTKGWYDPELDDRGNVKWRWMKKRGECRLVNPKADAVLFIDAWIPDDRFPNPANLVVKIADITLELPPERTAFFRYVFEISSQQLGSEDYVTLTFETDQTFIPAQEGESVDVRELGLMVKKILFRGK